MKPTKNGERELSDESKNYVDAKLQEVVDAIEKQAKLFGLNRIVIDTACADYLTLTENELSKLSPEELALAEIRLSGYSMTLQQHSNKALALKNWADRSLRLLVANQYNSFDKFMPYDARKDSIIVNNEYGERLGKIMQEQQIIIDEFSYLAQAAQHISDAFGRFAKIRRKE